jgi:cytochrome c oxidase subunit 4
MTHTLTARTYLIVCAILIVLTLLTLSVSFLPLSTSWHVALGLAIGLCKATLIVLFFMHALVSSRLTTVVISVSVFWLLILVCLTLTDYMSRNLVPFMPGH